MTKSDVYLVTLGTTGKVCLFNALDRTTHRARRKLIGSIVTERAMRNFEPIMSEQIDIFIQVLAEASETQAPVDVSERVRRLGADIVGLLAFGFPLNTQQDETHRFLPTSVTTGNGISNVKMQLPVLSSSLFVGLTNLLTHSQLRRFYSVLELMMSTRLSQEKHAQPDLYSHMIDSVKEGSDVEASDVWAEAMFLLPAGGDTTATGLSSIFFYLSRNPECYAKLADEIRTTFDGNDISGGPKLSGCRYLRACIDEALRMSPPVGGTLWRQPHAGETEPIIVDGHAIPPGTHVGVNCYAIHHDEAYFHDSYSYEPERWLEADEETRRRMNAAFCAFSIGPRGCAGKPMAYLEASLVVARTMWHFDFDIAPGSAGKVGEGAPGGLEGRHRPGEFQVYDIFSSTQSGPNLVFRRRRMADL
ncbi:hypothetical protein ACHAQA_003926 [Verticillium albo-atrum]